MSDSLILRPLTKAFYGDWELCLRTHDMSGTDYLPLCRVSMDNAMRLAKAGAPDWLTMSPGEMNLAQIKEACRAIADNASYHNNVGERG